MKGNDVTINYEKTEEITVIAKYGPYSETSLQSLGLGLNDVMRVGIISIN